MRTQKIKCSIEVSIFVVGGIQNAPDSELFVKWARGKNSIETKKQQGNRAKLTKFTDKFKMNSSLMTDSDGHLLPDINSLTVFCDNKEIGIVRFDLSKYYGRKQQDLKRADISSKKNSKPDDIENPVLESDAAQIYP